MFIVPNILEKSHSYSDKYEKPFPNIDLKRMLNVVKK